MNASGFKKGGVYVIAGGAGGIGRTLSAYLAKTYGARVAWLGRRAEDDTIRAAAAEIARAGGEAVYFQADIVRAAEVTDSFRRVRERWGRIDGVVHSAIVLRDRTLERMREEDFLAVVDPKIEGMVVLAQAARAEGAGWLLVFSSIVAFYNGPGQSNYNAGSAFIDSYARATERRHGLPVRVINWGFWGEVGVVATERYRREMAARGMASIGADEGMAAVERVLAGVQPQVVVLKATPPLLAEIGIDAAPRAPAAASAETGAIGRLRAELAALRDPELAPDAAAVARQLDGLRRLNVLATALLRERFRACGALAPDGAPWPEARLRTVLAVAPHHGRLLTALVALLREPAAAAHRPAADLRRELAAEHPDLAGYIELLDVCTEALPDVLAGRRTGTETMFPGGSLHLVERIYRGTLISDYFNRLMAAAVARTVARRLGELPPGAKVRIVEIGAGTGSTTEFVAEALRPLADRIEYVFTDVSAGFRRPFERTFAARFPFMRFAVFDLDRPAAAQELEPASADVVLAANALHVARNLHRALQTVKALLRPDGLLGLIEVECVTAFNSLTYGLLDGWWHADDAERRLPNAPLLSRTQWRDVLTAEGFRGAGSAERWRGETAEYFQTLLLAESDGQVAQSSHAPAPVSVSANGKNGSHVSPSSLRSLASPASLGSNGAHPAPPAPPAPQTAPVKAAVRAVLQKVFRLEAADLTDETSFDRLGVDSIVAVEVAEALNRALNIRLRSVDLFNYPNVGLLLERILEAHTPVVAAPAPAVAAAAPSPEPAAAPQPSAPAAAVARPGAIAIVGYSLRLPGADNAAEFWRNLAAGTDSVVEVPASRWPDPDYFAPGKPRAGRSYSRHAGLLSHVDRFDPLFFGISPHEAELMDPQQRLFLMESWKALEDAGYASRALSGLNCGVFAGASYGDYEPLLRAAGRDGEAFAFTGTAPAMLPARIAYWLNLKGPTLAVDTACSSSGVAIHLACESLQLGASDLALAGGVSVLATPRFHVLASQTGMLSPTGKCGTFGAEADGFVPGEGVAVLVLKRLADAERDGDRIHGVILGSATNQDGRTTGITSPNGPSQTALETGLYRRLGLNPETLGYVECHGTGTKIGDPIEIGALTEAFRQFTPKENFCALGAVKSNIGHTLMTAGAAGVIKALLALKHGAIPPTLHCATPNPQVDFARSPFFPNTVLRPWPAAATPRRAAVSAFGFSGTNVHLVLEEAPPARTRAPRGGHVLIPLSAKTDTALRRRAEDLAAWLDTADGRAASLDAVAETLGAGRTHFSRRLAACVASPGELRDALRAWLRGEASAVVQARAENTVASVVACAGPWGETQVRAWAEAYVGGADVDWAALYPAAQRQRISLPTYPFDLERFWVEPATAGRGADLLRPEQRPEAERAPQDCAPTMIVDALVFAPVWQPVPAARRAAAVPSRWLVCAEAGDDLAALVRAQAAGASVATLAPADLAALGTAGFAGGVPEAIVVRLRAEQATPEAALDATIGPVHMLMRALLRSQPTHAVRFTVLIPPDAGPEYSALGAYLAAATQEAPRVRVRLVAAAADEPALGAELAADDDFREVRLARGVREARRLASAEPADGGAPLFRDRGVCVITGGAGGLGWIFSRYLARTHRSRLVWFGRSAPGETVRARIRELETLGSEVLYVAGDVARRGDVDRLVQAAKARFGAVHAVIHAAGLFRNRFIVQKEPAELREIVAPKLLGAAHLDAALAGEPLDGLVLCSSVAGVVPEAGQGDYAYANRGLDDFAARRERLRQAGLRAGRTVSIDWQMWRDGGMAAGGNAVPDAAREHAAQTERLTGLPALTVAEGEHLLARAAASGLASGLFGRGDRAVLQARADAIYGFAARAKSAAAETAATASPASAAATVSESAVRDWLRVLLGGVLKLAPERIDATTAFSDYGVDSILVLKFNEHLAAVLPEASKTLLFEFANLEKLSRHVTAAHGAELVRILGPKSDGVGAQTCCAQEVGRTPERAQQDGAPTVPESADIAIIGVAGRFPGADDLETFWQNLLHGRDCIRPVPPERWDAAALADADPAAPTPGKAYCRWGGFVDGVDRFDAPFFNLPPVEAELMDPQQRLFLEVAWEALESAGYARSLLARQRFGSEQANVGVFAGVTHDSYRVLGVLRNEAVTTRVDHSGEWSLANRVSYFFNFSGPSFPVDTACSASLSAVHLACESLRRGECTAALAGAVNLHLHPVKYVNACSLGMLSPTGKCRPFGAGADGYVPGEGAGVLVLKPLAAAVRDGDPIRAVIKATAVNHGGRTNGFSVPNPAAQGAVVAEAIRRAGVDPRTITYLEAHGTGTELGDPIEVDGLKRAFAAGAAPAAWCALGSVKSNIGHLEAAAGVAGLAKVLLQMEHRTLVPSLHAGAPNPHIDFTRGPFAVQQTAAAWQRPVVDGREQPLRAGISSFGAGGSNAHLIVEEYPGPHRAESRGAARPATPEPIVLSARSETALRGAAARLAAFLRGGATDDLAAVAHTLQAAREAMPERLACVAGSVSELSARLDAWARGEAAPAVFRGRAAKGAADGPAADAAPEALAAAWVRGAEIDWLARRGDERPRVLPLPGYFFERKRYWYGSFGGSETAAAPAGSAAAPAPVSAVLPAPAPAAPVSHWRDSAAAFGPRPEVALEFGADGVAVVRMQDRAHRNMFTAAVLEGLMHAFAEIDGRDDVKAVVVTGADNVFSMGGTRDELLTLSDQVRTFASLEFIFKGFLQCRVPVIAAIQGHAQGGGLVFGLYADVVVMAEDALYSAVFTKYGFTPGLGATFILGDKLGDATATEMMMTAATYRGSELRDRGAGVTFRPQADVLATALALAREMAQKPATTLRTLKQGLAARKLARLPAIIADEVRMHGETFGQAEVKERIRHFIREEGAADRNQSGTGIPPAVRAAEPAANPSPAPVPQPAAPVAADDIRRQMRDNLCEKLHLEAATFDGQTTFRDLGLDSILSVEFIHGVNRAFGLRLDASIVYDFVNLDALAAHVAQLLGRPAEPVVATTAEAGRSETAPLRQEERAPVADSGGKVRLRTPAAVAGSAPVAARAPVRLSALAAPAAATVASTAPKPAPARGDEIAIIGMACRLPGARNLDEFWRNLAGGVDSVTEIPADRWDVDAFYSPDPQADGKSYCRTGGFVADVDRFDPLFFNLSHAEAEAMDPQQRLFLEEAWHALEHAGYRGKELAGASCGVFVGAGTGDYGATLRRVNPALAQSAFAGMGLTPSILAARLSYFLNLKGPGVAIDTACSSSLVALHQACRAIQAGDCTMALVGGVNLILEPDQLVTTSKLQMLSPGGRCRPFDNAADGIALSEGVAVIVVKSLAAALADGDRICGVVRGSGTNQDGKTNGITAPSAVSQAELERSVYRRAGVDPADIGLVEAHGTGTLLGDPVEVRGLTEAFRTFTDRTGYCALGSVKSNIGHTSFAAGIAGVIKVLLAFEHGRIPPSLHFTVPNAHIDFARSPFFVNTALRPWEPASDGRPRLAAVSSFGYSGTNAHVVLSDFPAAPAPRRAPLPPQVFARDRCWVRPPGGAGAATVALPAPTPDAARWAQRNVSTAAALVFVTEIAPDDALVRDHSVGGEPWLAGALLLERAFAAARAALETDAVAIAEFSWRRPLAVREAVSVTATLRAAGDGEWTVSLGDAAAGSVHAAGRVRRAAGPEPEFARAETAGAPERSRLGGDEFYARMAQGGLVYGPTFRLVREVTFTAHAAQATLAVPAGLPAAAAFGLLLEGLLQTAAVLAGGVSHDGRGADLLLPAADAATGEGRSKTAPLQNSAGASVPVSIGEVRALSVAEVLGAATWEALAVRRADGGGVTTFDLALRDGTGRALITVAAFAVKAIKSRSQGSRANRFTCAPVGGAPCSRRSRPANSPARSGSSIRPTTRMPRDSPRRIRR